MQEKKVETFIHVRIKYEEHALLIAIRVPATLAVDSSTSIISRIVSITRIVLYLDSQQDNYQAYQVPHLQTWVYITRGAVSISDFLLFSY